MYIPLKVLYLEVFFRFQYAWGVLATTILLWAGFDAYRQGEQVALLLNWGGSIEKLAIPACLKAK